jgi:hypothetical protein
MAHPLFDQILRHPCPTKYRKAKAPKGVETPSIPCSVQRFERVALIKKASGSRREEVAILTFRVSA